MLKKRLIFLESFESDFKGKKYVISRFVDVDTFTIFSGSNLNKDDLKVGSYYVCNLELKGSKLIVSSID